MNKYKLLYIIKEKGMTTDDFCSLIGMSRSAFSKKCNLHSEFTREEIVKIQGALLLTKEDVIDIFFAEKVS